MTERSVVLHCTEGGSDKLYALSIEREGEGYMVRYSNGRRGGSMAQGLKTKAPVSLEAANKLFEATLREKLAKHYQPIEGDAPVLVGEASRTDAGLRPQLLNPVTRAEALALCHDPDFIAQVKHDGERLLLRVVDGKVEGANRKGFLTAVPIEIVSVIGDLPLGAGETILDGERLGVHYAPFDLLRLDGVDLTGLKTIERHARLMALLGEGPSPLIRTHAATTTAAKLALIDSTEAEGLEGVVFKRASAPYTPDRPASGGDQFKLKHWETATCVVAPSGHLKRSIGLRVLDAQGGWVDIGNCTIPPNHPIPQEGALVEVRYLYYYRSGRLFQPTFLGVRTDVEVSDATVAQLKHKGEARSAA